MPTPAARQAFDEAKRQTARMQEVQVREKAVRESMESAADGDCIADLDKELVRLRAEWLRLSEAYTKAIARFMDEVEAARKAD